MNVAIRRKSIPKNASIEKKIWKVQSLPLSSTSLSFQFFIGLVVINMGKYQPFDLITLLLYYDLIELCFKIFNHLEAKSLTNCRLVSSHWRNFIDYQFNEMPKGRFIRSTNISNAYFSVEILTSVGSNPVRGFGVRDFWRVWMGS